MSANGPWTRAQGTETDGSFVASNPVEIHNFLNPVKWGMDLISAGAFMTNVPLGGSDSQGIDASTTGDFLLPSWNTALGPYNVMDRLTDFADPDFLAILVFQVRFMIRVSNAAINAKPILWYADTPQNIAGGSYTQATMDGSEVACSATSIWYDGSDQIQTIGVTLPSDRKYWAGGLTIAGTPQAGYRAWGRAWLDCFIQLP